MRWRRSGSCTKCSVRMLCSRSASFTSSTRMSRLIASTSLRKFSACLVRSDCSSSRVSLVTPSTRPAISPPNRGLDVRQLDLRVLDHVVQQPGGDRGGVQPVARQDVGHGERMGDVGIAVVAPLLAVRLLGQRIGGVDQPGIRLRIVSAQLFGQIELRGWPARGAASHRRAVGREDGGEARPRTALPAPPALIGGYLGGRPPSSASMAASRSSGDISSPSVGRLDASSSAVTSCRPKIFWSVGMRSSTSSSAGSGSGARDSDLIRSCSMRPRSIVSSAISRSATTGFLSSSRSMVSSSPR